MEIHLLHFFPILFRYVSKLDDHTIKERLIKLPLSLLTLTRPCFRFAILAHASPSSVEDANGRLNEQRDTDYGIPEFSEEGFKEAFQQSIIDGIDYAVYGDLFIRDVFPNLVNFPELKNLFHIILGNVTDVEEDYDDIM